MHPPLAGADQLLRTAIAERRLVTFTLDGFRRIAEPHDYGIIAGVARLFFYQIGGAMVVVALVSMSCSARRDREADLRIVARANEATVTFRTRSGTSTKGNN